MARMARLLRAMPELLILIKGMVAAMRSVAFTIGLLFIMLYVFGIAFVQLCDDTPCEHMFPDVINTMHTLLVNAALMDSLALLIEPLQEQNILLLLILYVFILLAALTVMNMLIGVICEVVSAVAATEREHLSLGFVKEKINELMTQSGADENNDQMISKEEFLNLLQNQKAVSILQDVGVDVLGLVDFADTIFEPDLGQEEGEERLLDFASFMNVVLDLRGGNHATVKDIVNLRKYINGRFENLEHKLLQKQRPRSTTSTGSCSRGEQPFPQWQQLHKLQDDQGIGRQHSKDRCCSCAGSRGALKTARSTSDAVLPHFQNLHRTLQQMLVAHEQEMASLLVDLQQVEALQQESKCEEDRPSTASLTGMLENYLSVMPSENCSIGGGRPASGQHAPTSYNSSGRGDSTRGVPSQRTSLPSASACSRCGGHLRTERSATDSAEEDLQHSSSWSVPARPRRGMPLAPRSSPLERSEELCAASGREGQDTVAKTSLSLNNRMSR